MALESRKPSRRRFLLGGLGVSGALIVGWGFLPPRQRLNLAHPLPAQNGEVALNGWLRIAPDGRVVLAMPRSEMGQGVHTALAMLVAEELDVPLSLITLEQAPRDKIFASIAVLAEGFPFHPDDQGMLKRSAVWLASKTAREFGINMTGGSTSMKDAWGPMREAGAAARAMLVDAAAARWQVPAGECRTADGYVSHANGQRAGYGELAALAAGKTPSLIRLKQPHEFRVIGSPKRRTDTPAKVNGSAVFGLDVRLPGMLYAAVKMSPTIGGKVVGVVAEPVLAMPGVLRVVDFSTRAGTTAGVAVIAATWWQASQALAALQISWNAGPNTSLDSAVVFRELAMRLDDDAGFTYHRTGDKKAGRGAARTINAEYRAPFLAHATMEPVNCTAQVKDGKVTVWASTQVPGLAASAARNVAGVADEDVTLHVTYLGGGFGRRLEVDMVRQAVAIAKMADGAPV
jgi:isoquinoline 1-oxidoreductase beta subunit